MINSDFKQPGRVGLELVLEDSPPRRRNTVILKPGHVGLKLVIIIIIIYFKPDK